MSDSVKETIKEKVLLGYDEHTHPAFGMIGISNVTGNQILVGSSVKHQHFISLTIHEAKKYRDHNHERWMSKSPIIEVYLSHTQLAEMLFNANHGDGVPCTIHYVRGESEYRPNPQFDSPMKRHTDDLNNALQETLQYAKDLAKEAEKLAQTNMTKAADRERMEFLAMKIVQDIESNLKYAAECIDEKIDKNIQHAKAEIESFINAEFRAAGIEHLKKSAPILIEMNDDNDK